MLSRHIYRQRAICQVLESLTYLIVQLQAPTGVCEALEILELHNRRVFRVLGH